MGSGLRFTHLTAKSPWADEFSTLVFSLGNSFHSVPLDRAIALDTLLQPLQPNPTAGIAEVIHHLLTESNHPPLYFILAHGWMKLLMTLLAPMIHGERSEFLLLMLARSLPAVVGVVSIPAIYGLSQIAFRSLLVAQLTAAMMAVSPYGIFLAQEARHYTLAILLVIASLSCLVVAARHIYHSQPLPLWVAICWIVINILGISTHYFFTLTLASEAIVLLALVWCQRVEIGRATVGEEELSIPSRTNIELRSIVVDWKAGGAGEAGEAGGENVSSLNATSYKRVRGRGGECNSRRIPQGSSPNIEQIIPLTCHPSLSPCFSPLQSLIPLMVVTTSAVVGGLVWLPVWLNHYNHNLTQWIYTSERVGWAWVSPVFQAIAAGMSMLALMPVEASNFNVMVVSIVVTEIFFLWVLPILYRGLNIQQQQTPDSRLAIPVFGGVVGSAIAILFFFSYILGIELTREARYNFVYFPAVIVLVAASLATCWNTPVGVELSHQSHQQSEPSSSPSRVCAIARGGKKIVAIVWLMGLLGGVTVVCNLGYQKYYRPDLLVPIIQQASEVPILIATSHTTHVQTGEMMGIAWEFKRSGSSVNPQFLLVHQEQNLKTSSPIVQQTLNQLPRPIDVWLVNFYRSINLSNCVADTRSLPTVKGYNYQLYHCR